jgi:hypothetical protein
MADESKTGNPPPSKHQTGEENNSMSQDEIDQLSGLLSESMPESKVDNDDTGSFTKYSGEDTGEFKRNQD